MGWSRRVARTAPVWLIAGAALVGFAAPRRSRDTGRVADVASVDAKMIFQRDCSTCHGANAAGTAYGPTLHGVGRASVDYWLTTGRMPLVADTRPAKSPQGNAPAGQRLADPNARISRHPPAYSPTAIAALENYIASIAPGGPGIPSVHLADANVAAGGETFRLQCAACHAWSGVGGALYQRAAPSLRRATPTQIVEAIRIGPGEMPAFGTAAVPADQLNDLAAYLRYLDHPNDRGGDPLWFLGPVAEGAVAIIVGLGLLLLASRWIGTRG